MRKEEKKQKCPKIQISTEIVEGAEEAEGAGAEEAAKVGDTETEAVEGVMDVPLAAAGEDSADLVADPAGDVDQDLCQDSVGSMDLGGEMDKDFAFGILQEIIGRGGDEINSFPRMISSIMTTKITTTLSIFLLIPIFNIP